jgi:hypothetical protein
MNYFARQQWSGTRRQRNADSDFAGVLNQLKQIGPLNRIASVNTNTGTCIRAIVNQSLAFLG